MEYPGPLPQRLAFGLTAPEGNHGADVKEYYFYLDNTPTHSYMRYLYKYPQFAYPYQKLKEKNRQRSGQGLEYELLDTGVFDEDRYFDIFVEYAKADADDICIRIEAFNRGPRCCISFLIFGFGIHGAGPFRVIRSLVLKSDPAGKVL